MFFFSFVHMFIIIPAPLSLSFSWGENAGRCVAKIRIFQMQIGTIIIPVLHYFVSMYLTHVVMHLDAFYTLEYPCLC